MNDLLEVTADHAAGNVGEHGEGHRIDLGDAKVRVDEVHAEWRTVEQCPVLLALMP